MAEWLIERGIGEERALLVENDRVLAAKHFVSGFPVVGSYYPARLVSRTKGSSRGTALTVAGFEVLVDKLPRPCTEGSDVLVLLTRAPIDEPGRSKLAQGRVVSPNALREDRGGQWTAREVSNFRAGAWEDVWQAASSGIIAFAGGEILCSATPAMTVIDVDGELKPKELALAAIPAIVQSIKWFEIGGSIGIDFPTLQTKAERAEVDRALSDALADWAHERTAINGFGFVQLVARLEGPSLLQKFATSRVAMCARYALRVGERVKGYGGALLVRCHPELEPHITEKMLSELARRQARKVRIETDPALALEAPHAQLVPL